MLMKKQQDRIFDYPPRFYKPEQDEDERRKRKLGFRKHLKIKRKKRSALLWFVIVLMVVFILLKLSGDV